jgi:hypothetical protein
MNNLLAEHHGITDQQMNFIFSAIKELKEETKNITYIEIGILYGGVLRRVLEKLDITDFAIGVDLFEDLLTYDGIDNTHKEDFCYQHELEYVLTQLGYNNFILYKGDAAKIVPSLPRINNGIAVIDANHTYEGCKIDFINIYNLINNGYIFFHDTDWDGPGRVAKEVEKTHNLKLVNACFGASIYRK